MTLFLPSSTLLTPGDPPESQRFVLASRQWLDLQTRIQAVLALPSDITEYEQRYGDASSGLQMRECYDAMRKLRQSAEQYGSPSSLRAKLLKDPGLLAGPTRPKNDAYSATIWTLEHAHNDAFALSSTLRTIPELSRRESPADATAGIRSLFLDRGQVVDRMQDTITQLGELIAQFEQLEAALDEAQLQMRTFTERSSKTRTELDKEIGKLSKEIDELEKARDAAYSKWLGLTISACIVPAVIGIFGVALMVILAVPTGGGSFAVGSAVTGGAVAVAAGSLGAAAGVMRSKYDGLVQQVREQKELVAKRVCYRNDLGALDTLMDFSLPSSNGILSQLRSIQTSWSASARELSTRAGELTTDNLANSVWLREGEMTRAADGWRTLDDALKAFASGSLVDASLYDFGAKLPADQPDWQQQLLARAA